MFFKTNSQKEKKSANIACWCTFVFWGLILFINSIFESFFNKKMISSSLTVLIAGLVIFFVVDLLFTFLKSKKKP